MTESNQSCHYTFPVRPELVEASRVGTLLCPRGNEIADSVGTKNVPTLPKGAVKLSKESIFHYCYAVLHDPLYREKYALNLKREFPRIPFYADFWQWAAWGEALMKLHIGYEAVEPFTLKRTDIPDEKSRAASLHPKAMKQVTR